METTQRLLKEPIEAPELAWADSAACVCWIQCADW